MIDRTITQGRFRKTAIVEARRWNPYFPEPVLEWLRGAGIHHAVLEGGRLGIGTLESGDGLDRHAAKPGDWVLRGAAGEFYACGAAVFAATYEAVEG